MGEVPPTPPPPAAQRAEPLLVSPIALTLPPPAPPPSCCLTPPPPLLHSEQSRCRFCNASLPDFKDALREGLPSPATPVMSVHFNNEVWARGAVKQCSRRIPCAPITVVNLCCIHSL